jgi:hypothetical protein
MDPIAAASSDPAHRGRIVYGDRDVLMGRGGSVNKHAGNRVYLRLIERNKDLYKTLSKEDKRLLTISILQALKNLGARFLQKKFESSETWYEVTDSDVLCKISQAIREYKKVRPGHIAAARAAMRSKLGSGEAACMLTNTSPESSLDELRLPRGFSNINHTVTSMDEWTKPYSCLKPAPGTAKQLQHQHQLSFESPTPQQQQRLVFARTQEKYHMGTTVCSSSHPNVYYVQQQQQHQHQNTSLYPPYHHEMSASFRPPPVAEGSNPLFENVLHHSGVDQLEKQHCYSRQSVASGQEKIDEVVEFMKSIHNDGSYSDLRAEGSERQSMDVTAFQSIPVSSVDNPFTLPRSISSSMAGYNVFNRGTDQGGGLQGSPSRDQLFLRHILSRENSDSLYSSSDLTLLPQNAVHHDPDNRSDTAARQNGNSNSFPLSMRCFSPSD